MKILVIGDSCIDQFSYGKVSRLNPEAPTPIFNPTYTVESEGMAGNVVRNLKALNEYLDITFITNNKKPIKRRLVDEKSNYTLIREDINDHIDEQFNLSIIDNLQPHDILIVSDYNKGFLSEASIFNLAKKCPISFLDTKKPISSFCFGYTFIKINNSEWETSVKHGCKGIDSWKNVIVTKGDKGCDYNGKNYPTKPIEVPNVSGAGDTFLAALVYEYLSTKDIEQSIIFANEISHIVVQKKGVSTI